MKTLRVMVLLLTLMLALASILYILDVFSGEYLKRVIFKCMAIMGIITIASIVVIAVIPKQGNNT